MRRAIGIFSGKTYTTEEYLNDQVKECALLVPDYVGDGEAYSYVSNHRIVCKTCMGCPVKQKEAIVNAGLQVR